jgi:hypothetical protein
MDAKSHLKPLSRLASLSIAIVTVLALFPVGNAIPAYSAQLEQVRDQSPQNSILNGHGIQNRCVPVKIIPQFINERQILNSGFFTDVFGSGSLDFARQGYRRYASFHLDPDPSGQMSASRMTEIDASLPPEQRVKCWQPTARRDVVVEFTARFEQPTTPPNLTENLSLWNAPIGAGGESLPMTAVSLTRNQMFPGYVAVVAQNLVLAPEPSGFLQIAPVPAWLDPTDWHQVRIRVSQQAALIEVAQGRHRYTEVLQVELPQPIEPLAFEFSLDNEVIPGVVAPITDPDTLDVTFLSIRYALPMGSRPRGFVGPWGDAYDKPLARLAQFMAFWKQAHK